MSLSSTRRGTLTRHPERGYTRQPSRRELAATALLAVSLAEASVKVRTGPPKDDPEDIAAGGRWAGILPVRTVFDHPEPSTTFVGDVVPAHVMNRL